MWSKWSLRVISRQLREPFSEQAGRNGREVFAMSRQVRSGHRDHRDTPRDLRPPLPSDRPTPEPLHRLPLARARRVSHGRAQSRQRASQRLCGGILGARPHSLTILQPRLTMRSMNRTIREVVLLALLSAFLCAVALIYVEPIATAVFAALSSGCVLIAAGLARG
jgi:hypothetical protein